MQHETENYAKKNVSIAKYLIKLNLIPASITERAESTVSVYGILEKHAPHVHNKKNLVKLKVLRGERILMHWWNSVGVDYDKFYEK